MGGWARSGFEVFLVLLSYKFDTKLLLKRLNAKSDDFDEA